MLIHHIGKCVVAGNVRRTAEIAFGEPNDVDYIALKDYKKNPQREAFGWASNNSVYATLGMNYVDICNNLVHKNGEPGFAWLDNMQGYSRMNTEIRDNKDVLARGGNPCLEQTLESYEMCCLVETFPCRHDNLEDYLKTLKCAMLYAKTVTLGATHWEETNAVLLRNRRIGCSMSGIAQFISDRNIHELKQWCELGYAVVQDADKEFSNRFAIPISVKKTCIKPSGTVSLLTGATPGMHYPESRYYLRRVRLKADSKLVSALVSMGYPVEPDVTDPVNTMIVAFPIDIQGHSVKAGTNLIKSSGTQPGALRTLDEISMWEQLGLASFLQKHWADNQVRLLI